jgi:hypothetical protein
MLSELRAYLIADTAVLALVSTRVWPTILPQSPVLPAVTYQVISAFRRPTLTTTDNLPEKRVQIDAWGKTFEQAHAVAEAVRKAIDGFQGTMGSSPGVEVSGIHAESERVGYEPDSKLHRESRDYMIWAREDG